MIPTLDLVSARTAKRLQIKKVLATDLLRLTRLPATEPYWGKGKVYRFDDPAQVFGATYTAKQIEVAFAETILHKKGHFINGCWLIDINNILERHLVTYTRPSDQEIKVADFTGVSLKSIGLDNDICSSDDYTDSMALSEALHAQLPDVDGIIYVSRQMNVGYAVALYERSGVEVDPVSTRLINHSRYDELLEMFGVEIVPSGRAPAGK